MPRVNRRTFVETAALAAGGTIVASVGGGLDAAPTIATRPFGKTGVQVSMVGLGGGARFYEPVPTDEAGAELVRRAIDSGITYIETAANYGPDEDGDCSERRIGLAMKTHRPRAFLETKTDQRDYDGAMREIERSLELLRTDRIDLLLHHNLESRKDLETIAGDAGADKAIRKLVDQKAIRFRGFSCHDPKLTLEAIARLQPDAIQLPLNATRIPDFEAEVLPLAREKGVAVIAMKVVGHGFFLKGAVDGSFDSRFKTDKNPELHRFAPPKEAFDKPHPRVEEFVRYALTLPIATALAGLDSMATLTTAIRIGSTFTPVNAADKQDIHRRAQVFAATGYWIPRSV
jgi:aryl-alcohol dehydrogenase-like predicted oxidoreductase